MFKSGHLARFLIFAIRISLSFKINKMLTVTRELKIHYWLPLPQINYQLDAEQENLHLFFIHRLHIFLRRGSFTGFGRSSMGC